MLAPNSSLYVFNLLVNNIRIDTEVTRFVEIEKQNKFAIFLTGELHIFILNKDL